MKENNKHSHLQNSLGDVSEKRFYITTPIYYASGKPHLGHAYTSIACDVLARWNRNLGKDVFFSTGTDEHGQKVEKNALKEGKTPKEFVDNLIPYFKEQLQKLNISYDYFLRTTNLEHKKFVQEMLQKCYDNGNIYLGEYEGLYCVDCEQYYKKDELINEKICPVHKKEVEIVKDKNYFFKLSKYQDELLKIYETTDFLAPKSIAKETINFVKEGLEDISISRNKEKLNWGIELPFDKNHVTYVWFDALFNYISLLKINGKEDFWPANLHLVGKDIMRFHKIYWPAFLLSTGYELPKKVFAHGWWTVDGEKMGKSLGNVINPIDVAEKYGVDEFRYFVLNAGSFGEDQNFTYELFAEKINNELNNDLGNLVSRVHAMVGKYFEGVVPKIGELNENDNEFVKKLDIFEEFDILIQNLEFNKAFELLWTAIRETNAYVNLTAPWKEQDMVRLGTVMNILSSSVVLFAKYLNCIIPEKSTRIFKQYNVEKNFNFKLEFIDGGHKLGEKDNLFSKIILEKKEESNLKEKEGFALLNLKIGQIVNVEKHPDSDKLYVLQVNIGDEKRQIVSGLQQIYEIKDLENRKVVVITNLKPAKLGGFDSNGMVLACEDPVKGHDDCGLLTTDLEIGTQIICGDAIADNDKQIKSKVFQRVEMNGKGGKVYFEGKELKGVGIDKGFEGRIC